MLLFFFLFCFVFFFCYRHKPSARKVCSLWIMTNQQSLLSFCRIILFLLSWLMLLLLFVNTTFLVRRRICEGRRNLSILSETIDFILQNTRPNQRSTPTRTPPDQRSTHAKMAQVSLGQGSRNVVVMILLGNSWLVENVHACEMKPIIKEIRQMTSTQGIRHDTKISTRKNGASEPRSRVT